ncbi:MAG: hypothetical protein HY763_08610 [Planctomycetes bacterium]|nr:hypothetical protein [Planctomycetota bacterium]
MNAECGNRAATSDQSHDRKGAGKDSDEATGGQYRDSMEQPGGVAHRFSGRGPDLPEAAWLGAA